MKPGICICLVAFLLMSCAGLLPKKDLPPKDLPEFSLVWESGKLLRIDRFRNSGVVRGKGGVKAECSGATCTKAQTEQFPPARIKGLAKHGFWEEFTQSEDPDLSTPDNKVFRARIDQIGEYVDGKRVGVWKKPDPDDPKIILATVPWVDGKREGISQSFSREGNLLSEVEFKNDKKTGAYWRKNSRGEWVEKGSYVDDEEDGLWTTYFTGNEGNTIKSTSSYKLGKKQGLETNFYPNGRIESQGNYTAYARTGAWKLYNSQGQLTSEGNYSAKEGGGEGQFERTGVWKEYYPNGNLFGVGTRKHTRQGNWKFYYSNGQLAYDGVMANEAQLESAKIFSDSGVALGEGKIQFSLIKIDEESGNLRLNYRPSIPFIYFYASGKKRLVIRSEDDATEYDESGAVLGTGPVTSQGKKNGCWTVDGKKIFFMNDASNPRFTEMQCK